MAKEELVVLVDEQNNVVGTMPKATVHGAETPLHRGFSSFIFRESDKKLLLQQRSHVKKVWPLMWSNSCCGHPGPNETNVAAAKRRLWEELRLKPTRIEEVAPYRYRFIRDGVMENEICPILVGMVRHDPMPNPTEVEAVEWVDWGWFLEEIERHPTNYSEWCVEEARILADNYRFKELLKF